MESHHILFGLILFIILCVAAVAIMLWRRSHDPLAPHKEWQTPRWVLGIFAAIIYCGFMAWIDERDQNIIAEARERGEIRKLLNAGYLRPDRAWFNVNLNDCPPRTDGMTDQVVMAIKTQPDGKHIFGGCARIAQRPYIVKPKKPAVRG